MLTQENDSEQNPFTCDQIHQIMDDSLNNTVTKGLDFVFFPF